MGKKKKVRERMAAELAQETEEWKDYLMADLRERIRNNGGKMLSERKLKKTSNGDATYERMVRVVGRGRPDRLRQEVAKMVQEVQKEQMEGGGSERRECLDSVKHFESAEHFEKPECFEMEESFEESGNFEEEGRFEVQEDLPQEDSLQEDSRLAEKTKRQRWDKASLTAFLREKCRELGRVLMVKDISAWSKAKLCPSYPTCMKILEVESKAELEKLLSEG